MRTATAAAAHSAALALLLVVQAVLISGSRERCPWPCVSLSECRSEQSPSSGTSGTSGSERSWMCPGTLVCCRDRLPSRSRGVADASPGAGATAAAGSEGDVWFPDAIPTPRPSLNRPPGDATKRPPGLTRYDHTTRRSYGYDHTTRRSLYTDPAARRQYDQDGRGRRANASDASAVQRPYGPYAEPSADPPPPGPGWYGNSRFRPSDLNANRAGWGSQGAPSWGPPGPSSSPPSRQRTRQDTKGARVSEQKCNEFARLQTERVVALPLVPDPKPSVQHVQKCDSNSVPLVVGGQDARLHEFPHMAAIGYRGAGTPPKIEWNCGGSLISELFVITAAHCTATAQGPPVRVRLGEHNLESAEDGARPMDIAVSSMVRHPGYQPPSRYHDIGLLRLARKVPFSAAVRPACLHVADEDATEDDFNGEPLIATGWGHTEQLGERSQVLQKVILNSVDQPTCNNLYSADSSTSSLSKGIVGDSQLCAGVLDGGKDTCQGDSGGPLQVTSRDNQCVFHVVGITSFGKVCAARNSPGVYTRVSKYISWIERHVWPEA